MNIDQMRMVLALAESGSMTVTAKKLQVTQPALTYQIKTIEAELGFSLFNRSRTGTTPTPEGAYLFETLRKLVNDYDEGVRLSRAMAQGASTGTVRVGTSLCSRDTVSAFLRAAQGSLLSQGFSLIPCGSSNPLDLLREGVIDFWSASDSVLAGQDDLRILVLSEVRSMLYVPLRHPLASKKTVELEDLADETVWMWPKGVGSAASDSLRDEFARRGIAVDIQDYTQDTSTRLTMLASDSLAIYDTGFLPPPSHIACAVPLHWEQGDRLGLVYMASSENRLAAVLSELKEQVDSFKEAGTIDDVLEAGRIATILDDIVKTVSRGGMRDIIPLVDYALEMGAPPDYILSHGVLAGMDAANDLYKEGATYTSEMLAAVATSKLAAEELTPLLDQEGYTHPIGTAVIATVQGDRHELGKNLVRIALEGRGIEVEDLGRQVKPQQFVDYVSEHPKCNLVLISMFRTEVRPRVCETIAALEKAGLRERVFVMLGGPAADTAFVEEAGADAYTEDALDAARTAYHLLSY